MSKSAIGTSKTIYEIRSTLNVYRSDGAKDGHSHNMPFMLNYANIIWHKKKATHYWIALFFNKI
jgi:hypothetical protein